MLSLFRRAVTLLRDLRWRALRWSAAADQQFHDAAFQALADDPFSAAYPGSITIRRFADLSDPFIGAGASILDLGCGPGEITCELARRRPDATFLGVDHSRQAIEVASRHARRLGLPNIQFDVADVAQYAPAGRVDMVVMFNAFHHLVDPAGFVARFRVLATNFLLIEPVGDRLGRWRSSLDFDWVAAELDKLRARADSAFGVPVAAPDSRPATDCAGEPVEHRYTLDDFESFFKGFSLTIRGTVSGLVEYPPGLDARTAWREFFGEVAYSTYRAIDERLYVENRDLWGRHWVVYATPGPRLPGREAALVPDSTRLPATVAGPYDVVYEDYEGPDRAPADSTFTGEVGLRNTGFAAWSSDDPAPVFLSYRWLTARGLPVPIEGRRSRLPRALVPGSACRVPLHVQTPTAQGRYTLAIDLVKEGVTWFSEAGQVPLKVKVTVTPRRT